jgi:hypothetical protein
MSWKNNAIMYWSDNVGNLHKISDHNRSPLSESYERIERSARMVDGSMRRYTVAKKRSWSTSWSLLPARNVEGGLQTVDGGLTGYEMEWLYNINDDAFAMVLRRGSAGDKPNPNLEGLVLPHQNEDFYIARVMFTDFSKEVVHRGKNDLWNIDVTLEEV